MSRGLVAKLPAIFDAMVAALKVAKDWPRLALFLAWYGQLDGRPGFWRGMTPNHLIETHAALYIGFGDLASRDWLLTELREQRTTGMFRGEQLTQVYPTYYVAPAVAIREVAERRGDRELVAEADRYLAAVLALWAAFFCPAAAHPEVAQRVLAPGCRSGTEFGEDYRTDAVNLALQGRPIPGRWRLPDDSWSAADRHPWMEAELVLEARRQDWLPVYAPAAETPPILSECQVEYFAGGHRASFERLEKCAGFPLWSLAVDYRTGRMASVTWRDWQPPPKKPSWMGLGKASLRAPKPPATLPDLGVLVARVTLGPKGAVAERPPAPTPPGRPAPPAPPPPPPPSRPAPGLATAVWSAASGRLLLRLGGHHPEALEAVEAPDPGVVLQLRDTVDQERRRPVSIVYAPPNRAFSVEGAGPGRTRHLLDVETIATGRPAQLVVETHGDRSRLYYIREHRPRG